MRLTRRAALAAVAATPAFAPGARGQEAWPARPVRFLVPYPPGGPTDILARVVAQRLTAAELGQPG